MERFNFTAHLKAIVKPMLVGEGFVMKGTKFTRANKAGTDEIYFQRSSWNLPVNLGAPSEFYLNASLTLAKPFPGGRIARPTTIQMPAHFAHLRSLARSEEKNAFVESLTDSQRSETSVYLESTQWLYGTEKELVGQLILARDILAAHINGNTTTVHGDA